MISRFLLIALVLSIFACAEPPSAPGSDILVGDINGDGLAFTVADAVLFDQLLISEALVQSDTLERAYQASDVNGDGDLLSLADNFLVWRTVWGDAIPSNSPTDTVDMHYSVNNNTISVSDAHLGAMRVICRTDTPPELLEDAASLHYEQFGNLMVILVPVKEGADTVDDSILRVNGDIISIELCTYDCRPGRPAMSPPPQQFYLEQAYPNPFTRDTEITFGLAEASDWSLEIINVIGTTVGSYDGHAEAGTITITWPGDAYPAGAYFYRLTVGEQSIVKKLLLI